MLYYRKSVKKKLYTFVILSQFVLYIKNRKLYEKQKDN